MKASLTDRFLWDVYNFLEKADDAARFVLRRRRTMYDIMIRYKNPVFEQYRKERNRRRFSVFIHYLKKHNYIKVKNLQGEKAVILTKEGINKVLQAKFKVENKQLKKRSDNKWIMIIFDIPQKNQKARRLLRSILQNLGYKIFQHSVWITPYDVGEKTEKLLQSYSLDKYVRIFIVEKV